MVPCDNKEGEIQEDKVIYKEEIAFFFYMNVSTGYQHVIKYNNFVRCIVLSGVHTSKNESYCVRELCPERLNTRSILEPFVSAL